MKRVLIAILVLSLSSPVLAGKRQRAEAAWNADIAQASAHLGGRIWLAQDLMLAHELVRVGQIDQATAVYIRVDAAITRDHIAILESAGEDGYAALIRAARIVADELPAVEKSAVVQGDQPSENAQEKSLIATDGGPAAP